MGVKIFPGAVGKFYLKHISSLEVLKRRIEMSKLLIGHLYILVFAASSSCDDHLCIKAIDFFTWLSL